MIVEIPNIEPYFNTKMFLVDLHTGNLFTATQGNWHRLEVGWQRNRLCNRKHHYTPRTCQNKAKKTTSTHRQGSDSSPTVRPNESKGTTNLEHSTSTQFYPPHTEAMSPTARKNYIKDRTQVATIYITEYSNTRLWELENQVPPENLQQRLQIVFRRTNAVRETIDNMLERDNGFRIRTNMRYLEVPIRFPTPDTMHNYETSQLDSMDATRNT